MGEIELLTTKEAAQLLRMHPDTLSRMAKAGKVPATKPFGVYRFHKATLLAWLDEHTTTALLGLLQHRISQHRSPQVAPGRHLSLGIMLRNSMPW
jgi:excisionase family DNA binding protein